MRLTVMKKSATRVLRRFDTSTLKDVRVQQEWGIQLRNRFHALAEGDNINDKWERCKLAFIFAS